MRGKNGAETEMGYYPFEHWLGAGRAGNGRWARRHWALGRWRAGRQGVRGGAQGAWHSVGA